MPRCRLPLNSPGRLLVRGAPDMSTRRCANYLEHGARSAEQKAPIPIGSWDAGPHVLAQTKLKNYLNGMIIGLGSFFSRPAGRWSVCARLSRNKVYTRSTPHTRPDYRSSLLRAPCSVLPEISPVSPKEPSSYRIPLTLLSVVSRVFRDKRWFTTPVRRPAARRSHWRPRALECSPGTRAVTDCRASPRRSVAREWRFAASPPILRRRRFVFPGLTARGS